MPSKNRLRPLAKRSAKKSFVLTKKILIKSKTAKRAVKMARRIIMSGVGSPNHYDVAKYAPTIAEYQRQVTNWQKFKLQPLISIVMPTYNTPTAFLEACIESVQLQSYPHWELCIADDASPNRQVIKTIKRYAKTDDRIKLVERKKNGHISLATNSAIKIARGEFIALLDHDDVLWPNALYEVIKTINAHPTVNLIYTDEDKLDEEGTTHSYPFFKPDWSPEFLESCNYITHFTCIRANLVKEVGGLRKGYEGAQDWDLFLRVTEKTDLIIHIPKVLYSWRIHEASTALDTDAKPYVFEAQHKLLIDHVTRSGIPAKVKVGIIKQHSSIEYEFSGKPTISILVYGNNFQNLKSCLQSIATYTTYEPKEILVVSSDKKIKSYLTTHFNDLPNYKFIAALANNVIPACNTAINLANGDYIILINGDMEVATSNWVELMLGDIQRPGVGAVGGRTLCRDKDRLLRTGIGMGVYGLFAPLLEWMAVEDVHYMRGIYAQSRRDVAAVDNGCIIVAKEDLKAVNGFDDNMENMLIVDLCLKLLEKNLRIIYNPFIDMIDLMNLTAGDAADQRSDKAIAAFTLKWQKYIDYDPYLNAAFSRVNAQLEIK